MTEEEIQAETVKQWNDPFTLLTILDCPECHVMVGVSRRVDHDKWHKMLPIRNMMGMLF